MSRRIVTVLLIGFFALGMAQNGNCRKLFSIDAQPPDTDLVSSSFIDILFNDGRLWLAGGYGLSLAVDSGWLTFSSQSGLNADNPSALFGRPGEVWVACSHSQEFQGVSYPFGDGFNRTTDFGTTWDTIVPPDSSASKFGKLVYDIAGNARSVYAACFYGGLIVSHDNGTTWKHLFFSPADSSDWAADNWPDLTTGRYYSCLTDTFHTDTSIVYAGSAEGIHKYLYFPKRVKLAGNQIFDICGQGNTIYLATEGGVSRTDSTLEKYFTSDSTNFPDGLPVNAVRRLFMFAGRIWAAPFDRSDSSGKGLYYSVDSGLNWSAVDTSLFSGDSSGVFDYNIWRDSVIYIAAGDSGVMRSIDTGKTFQRFFSDSTDMLFTSDRNRIYSIDVAHDTIYLGTRAGLVKIAYLPPFQFTGDTLITFPETKYVQEPDSSSGGFVNFVRHYDTAGQFTWVGLLPLTANGEPGTIFIDSLGNGTSILNSSEVNVTVRRIVIVDSTLTIIAADKGIYLNPNNGSFASTIKENVSDPTTGRTMNAFDMLSTAMINGRLFSGSMQGVGYRVSRNIWRIQFANTDSLTHDLAVSRNRANADLPGNWVVALDIQPMGDSAVLWAACRGVPDTLEQFNAAAYSTDFGSTWQSTLQNEQVWNFAFVGDTAYAAASSGLYFSIPPWTTWTRAVIIDHQTKDTIISATEVFCAEAAGDTLWVGTELGLASLSLDSLDWNITRIFKSTESDDDVFAAPVPYSPLNFDGRLSIHYRVPAAAEVTVEIYDFAMNLVRRVADHKPRAAGSDFFETWDGYNERGDMVATGIYYIKVTFSTGEERWGRLAIIP